MIDARIRLRHLAAFLEISRRKSVSRAAEALHLTQPAISKTLAELEDILGLALMTRSRAGIALTPAGEVFLHYAATSHAALRQGIDAIAQTKMAASTPLAIGALPSVAARVIPGTVMRFRAARPGAIPRIVTGPNGYLLDQLRLGELDLVVGRLGSPEAMRGLSFAQLYSERIAVVVRPGHPLIETPDIARITEFSVLLPERGAAIRALAERFLIANGIGELPNRIETVADAFGRAFTRQTDAVWIISNGVVALDLAEGALVELPFDMGDTSGPVGLTLRTDAPDSPALRMFTTALREVTRALQA
ncbi:MAG: pca operon transcription factor PcaQ [Rhizobiales bacterium PAR1]|nr:MAG: pca operon transcription factor PcaQ [Rhizobiales bacterium PAR1]